MHHHVELFIIVPFVLIWPWGVLMVTRAPLSQKGCFVFCFFLKSHFNKVETQQLLLTFAANKLAARKFTFQYIQDIKSPFTYMYFNCVLDVCMWGFSIFELFCVNRTVKVNEIKIKKAVLSALNGSFTAHSFISDLCRGAESSQTELLLGLIFPGNLDLQLFPRCLCTKCQRAIYSVSCPQV